LASTSLQSRATLVLTITIGCGGTLILGIQPLLLETLLAQGLLSTAGVGWAATVEVLAMAVGVLSGARMLVRSDAKAGVVICAVAMTLANYATLAVKSTFSILLLRTVSGFCEGVMVAVAVMSISYSNMPGRLNAIFLTAGTTPQMVLAYVIPSFLVPAFGRNVGFAVMALTGLLCGVLALCVRERFAPAREPGSGRIEWTRTVILVLSATIVTAAAIGACWGYAGPLAAEIGMSSQSIGLAVTASLIFQVLGSLIVAIVGYRLSFRIALLGGVFIQVLAAVALLRSHGSIPFTLALCVFGFLWQGCMPFAMDLMVAVDKSRATAPLILPLMIGGLSVGPFVASFAVGETVTPAFWVGIVGFAASFLIYVFLFRQRSVALPEELATSGG